MGHESMCSWPGMQIKLLGTLGSRNMMVMMLKPVTRLGRQCCCSGNSQRLSSSLQTHGFHTVELFYLIDMCLLIFSMISLKAVRNQLFIRHDGVSNDDELLFWCNLNRSYNLNLPYVSYPDFNFDDLILLER